jgi:hypothetical protein
MSNAEQLRRQVSSRLGVRQPPGEAPPELTLEQAHALVARMHGFESWRRLLADAV